MEGNFTIPDDECTLQTCTLAQAHYTYLPSLGGNAFYAGWFGLLIVLQIVLVIRYRIWGYFVAMFGGLVLEILGYVARIQMHFNPFTKSPYSMYLVCLTIAPAFLGAAVYLCLSRIVVVYGQKLSRFRPRTYTVVFIACDVISLFLQAAGGGVASGGASQSSANAGKDLLLAGLGFQVAATLLFTMACAEFAWRVHKAGPDACEPTHMILRSSWKFRIILWSLGLAITCIFTRSVYRVAELSQGLHGALANQEVTFMILEGAMIFIASGSQTFLHPGFCFQGSWEAADFSLGRSNRENNKEDLALSDMNNVVENGGESLK
ncbi:RTA1 like protein-domain-containing protein [Lipomyces tetrasporus]|uniref:Sphingoid long-chain base transporter RSB1 n=1 Tax=Lipomyces tetrasporus TaxID=54092 RepID=A0AAD7R0L1_9ASCO|nr:RTA1 like protein-domain-containing protein [Lipomyces tetrasporus]KAJ8103397.1 RTA1 like protein-domain-containing protein [Lipomyces tetrasporus]